MTEGTLLAGRGVTKSFGHVEALKGVDFDVPADSITGLWRRRDRIAMRASNPAILVKSDGNM